MKRSLAIGLVGLLLLFAGRGYAQTTDQGFEPSFTAFKQVPLVLNGRVVPLDTFARQVLLRFSGRSALKKEPAISWLARLFFDTASADSDPVFLINHPEVPEALGLQVSKSRRYSYDQLAPSIERLGQLAMRVGSIEDKDRSIVEREIYRVYGNLSTYLGLRQTFTFANPNPLFNPDPELRAFLNLPEGADPLSFLDVLPHAGDTQEIIDPLQEKPQAEWTPFEQKAFALSSAIFRQAQQHRGLPLALVPVAAHGDATWLPAWEALSFGFHSPEVMTGVSTLAGLSHAYQAHDALGFDLAATDYVRSVHQQLPANRELKQNRLEILYNQLDLFYRSVTFYWLAFLFAFAALLTRRAWVKWTTVALLVLALIPHTAGIVMRMVIMGRPPMTNLYATFLFVAWVSVVLCLLVEYFQRHGLGLLMAGFSGFGLLLLAQRFGLDGDQMGKVVAVLDSNFWLSTHVVCITTGYAGCMVAGIIAHVYLLQAIIRPGDRDQLRSIQLSLYAVLGFGLTFAFFGTMLGGVWADQSWGRFWGWDPKENGALLIVLWCAILFHARLAGLIRQVGFAVGAVLGMVVVMFAWLGVNLLGVGLHSYGFTSGLARGLYLYTAIQILVAAVAGLWARRRLAAAR